MNVNFTGMQNVGVCFDRDPFEPKIKTRKIAIQLNNNGENDLDDFKKLLKDDTRLAKTDFIEVDVMTYPNKRNPGNLCNDLYVNGKGIEINDENLPIITKINGFLKRIMKGEEKTPLQNEYLKSTACEDRFIGQTAGQSATDKKEILKDLHKTENVKFEADKISKRIINELDDYYKMSKPFSDVASVGGINISANDTTVNRLCLEIKDEDKAVFKHYLEPVLALTYEGDDDILKLHDQQRLLDELDGKIEPSNTTNDLNVTLVKNETNGETDIYLNDKKIKVNEKNIPVFKRLAEMMSKMSKTDQTFPFPKMYMYQNSLSSISNGLMPDGELERQLSMQSDENWNPNESKFNENEESEESGEEKANIKMVKSDFDVKDTAKTILNVIDKKMDKYFS